MTSDSPQRDRAPLIEAALEASGQAVWEWDLLTGELGRTQGFPTLLGYEDNDSASAGPDWLDLVHPDDRGAAQRHLEEHIAGRNPRFEAELRLRKSNGEFLRVLSRGQVAERDASNRPALLVGAHFDIASRANLEQRLAQARRMETIGLFAAGIAHDFNNLLTVIGGYGELLAQRQLSEADRELLGPIRSAGALAAYLVRRLLAFSRRRAQESTRIDLNGIVRDLTIMLQRLLPENIRMVNRLEDGLGTVMADAGSLDQVLMNLVLNARDAMPEGGTLDIATANLTLPAAPPAHHPKLPPGNYVTLTVSDTGIGMDEITRQRVFDPFHSTKPPGAGTGLGLSTVYGIVKQSGGWIAVRSERGAGTTFRVYLPRVEEQAPAAVTAFPPMAVTGTESVLVVEDNIEVRRFVRAALESLGYSVAEAVGREEAAAVFQRLSGRIDLLIVDSILPDGSGQSVARQLAAARPELAVLHISGYGEPAASAAEGAIDFLAKPFTGQVLAQKAREVLRKRRPRMALVVASDAEAAQFLQQALSQSGLRILIANTGKDAIAEAESGAMDLVIVDLSMPRQEALDTIIALRKLQPAAPVIAMSGDQDGQLLKMALALGVRDSIRKPSTAAALHDLVRRTLFPS